MKIAAQAAKRFAVDRLLPLLKGAGKDIYKTVKPDFSTGQGMLDAAFRFGPDLMFPLVACINGSRRYRWSYKNRF